MKSKILLIGGAGYIGSHVYQSLKERGDVEIHIVDDLSTGNNDIFNDCAINHVACKTSINNENLKIIFNKYKYDCVMHFASKTSIAESEQNPQIYYVNNVIGTFNVLELCRNYNVKNFIFSSSASVYGEQKISPVKEGAVLKPSNVYGNTKLICEKLIEDYSKAYKLNYTVLRYFNVCGANPDGSNGDTRKDAAHLIPIVIEKIKKGETIYIYGNNHFTKDKTAIRDYVHVMDIANANSLCLDYMLNLDELNDKGLILNLGSGTGTSVKEVIRACEKVLNKKTNVSYELPRAGDIAKVYADISLAKEILNWEPKYSNIDDIVQHSVNWMNINDK